MLKLVKQWLTVVNCVLIIVANYLTTVKQCLPLKNYVSFEKSPLDEVKKNIKILKKWKCQKCQRLTHFFNNRHKYIKKFVKEQWLAYPNIPIYQK